MGLWNSVYNFIRTGSVAGSITPVDSVPDLDEKPALGTVASNIALSTAGGGGTGYGFLCGYGPRPEESPQEFLNALRHPVLACARAYALNPIKTGTHRIGARPGTPDARVNRIVENTKGLFPAYLQDATWSVDLGFAAWQIAWTRRQGKYAAEKLIACRQEFDSGILTDKDTNEPVGVRWNGIDLFGHKAFFTTNERRGQEWLGQSRISNVFETIDQSRTLNDKTARLANKASGILFGVGYPPGNARDKNGVEVSRDKQAADYAKQVISGSGYFTYPLLGALTEQQLLTLIQTKPAEIAALLKLTLWDHKLLDLGDPSGSISAITEDKQYLDRLICLGYFVPPEAILMGDGGNRAKTEAAGGFGTAVNETVNRTVTESFNRGVVDSDLVLNDGEEARGSVWWEADPLEDPQELFDKQILTAAIQGTDPLTTAFNVQLFGLQAIADRNGLKMDLGVLARVKEFLSEQPPTQPPSMPRTAASANGLNGHGDFYRGASLLGRIDGGGEW